MRTLEQYKTQWSEEQREEARMDAVDWFDGGANLQGFPYTWDHKFARHGQDPDELAEPPPILGYEILEASGYVERFESPKPERVAFQLTLAGLKTLGGSNEV